MKLEINIKNVWARLVIVAVGSFMASWFFGCFAEFNEHGNPANWSALWAIMFGFVFVISAVGGIFAWVLEGP